MVTLLGVIQLWLGTSHAPFFAVGTVWVMALAIRRSRDDERDRARAAKELRAAQSEVERLNHELTVSQRMDSLGRLAGAFSHEFNNQLMAIRIHADLLEQSLPPGSPQRRDVEQIRQTTSAAADLTSRLLAFSRPSRSQEDPADLCEALHQNAVTLRHLAGEPIAVTLSVPDGRLYAPVGAKPLGQILLNLALNARDAMPRGGSLRVELARIPRSSVELPVEMPSEQLVRLTVSDSGSGMSPDVRDRLFEPFFTTKAERGNSGLGLSVVYGLVKESGGHVRVTSEPGKGARFDLYWPEVAPAAARAGERAQPSAVPKRARVLLIEDQALLRDGIARWLGDQGYAVIACESAEEALARANDVDVIASDVVLRGMDGIELLARLRRSAPALPAVLFSGHLDHMAARRREIPEGVTFLEKPFAPELLLSTLASLVEAKGARSTSVH
jgi:two-component system cell cycle sensor histidine kinase/response regulator CckA